MEMNSRVIDILISAVKEILQRRYGSLYKMMISLTEWRWYTGEKPCVPWEHPERVLSGDCYKSHFKRETTKGGAQCSKLRAGQLYYLIIINYICKSHTSRGRQPKGSTV